MCHKQLQLPEPKVSIENDSSIEMDLYCKIYIRWHSWSLQGKTSGKDYIHTYEIDYEETFAPMTNMDVVRILLSLVVYSIRELQYFDVKNLFLHGN